VRVDVRIAIIPNAERLRILINPNGEIASQVHSPTLFTLFAPWPDAYKKGLIETEIEGDTLRALLTELGHRYKQAKVDFEPICPRTNDLKLEFNVFVNGKDFILLPHGLDTKLKDGDEVRAAEDIIGLC